MGCSEDDEDYERDDQDEPCDHESYDADVITGQAYCYRCRRSWWMSKAEMDAEMRFMREAAEAEAEEMARDEAGRAALAKSEEA